MNSQAGLRLTSVEFSDVDIVFHAGDLPAALPTARQGLAAFVAEVRAALCEPPLDHVNHPYWIGGVETWRIIKQDNRPFALPPELPTSSPARNQRVTSYNLLAPLLRLGRGMLGTASQQGIWRPRWADLQLGREALTSGHVPGGRPLLVGPRGSFLLVQDDNDGVVRRSVEEFLRDLSGRTNDQFDRVIMHIPQSQLGRVGLIVTAAAQVLRSGGKITVFVDGFGAQPCSYDLGSGLITLLEDVLPRDWVGWMIKGRFVGGRWRNLFSQAERALFQHMVPRRAMQIPRSLAAIAAWGIVGSFFMVNNVVSRRATANCPLCCTAALIELSRLTENTAS